MKSEFEQFVIQLDQLRVYPSSFGVAEGLWVEFGGKKSSNFVNWKRQNFHSLLAILDRIIV